jgi:hypothetical protein
MEYIVKSLGEPAPITDTNRSSLSRISEQSMGAKNRVGIGWSYWPTGARIYKSIKEPRNRFPAWRNQFFGIDSWTT